MGSNPIPDIIFFSVKFLQAVNQTILMDGILPMKCIFAVLICLTGIECLVICQKIIQNVLVLISPYKSQLFFTAKVTPRAN